MTPAERIEEMRRLAKVCEGDASDAVYEHAKVRLAMLAAEMVTDPWAPLFAEVRAEIERITTGATADEGLLPDDSALVCLDVATQSMPSSNEMRCHREHARKQMLLAVAWLMGAFRALDREAGR